MICAVLWNLLENMLCPAAVDRSFGEYSENLLRDKYHLRLIFKTQSRHASLQPPKPTWHSGGEGGINIFRIFTRQGISSHPQDDLHHFLMTTDVYLSGFRPPVPSPFLPPELMVRQLAINFGMKLIDPPWVVSNKTDQQISNHFAHPWLIKLWNHRS